jgi:hypothetical protein
MPFIATRASGCSSKLTGHRIPERGACTSGHFERSMVLCEDFIACYGRIFRYSATEAVHAMNGRITRRYLWTSFPGNCSGRTLSMMQITAVTNKATPFVREVLQFQTVSVSGWRDSSQTPKSSMTRSFTSYGEPSLWGERSLSYAQVVE